jgi:hypothetical protein
MQIAEKMQKKNRRKKNTRIYVVQPNRPTSTGESS